MERFSCDAVVIGGGAVGLAVARALALAGHQTMILEKHAHIGTETSARNSEVIHAGIYYPKGWLKAEFCVRGRHMLYAFCESHGVSHKRLGKLVVATHDRQGEQLAAIAHTAATNGVDDLSPLTAAQIAELEPDLAATEGLLSPSTGIIDSHQYMLALLGDAEHAGASLVRNAAVRRIAQTGNGWRVTIDNAGETLALDCRLLVNSAGLWAVGLAAGIEALAPHHIPTLYLAKGNYVTLSAKNPFRHLIYPVPEPGGLGVHLTLDMGGGARFGPDVEWLTHADPARIDYAVAADAAERFAPVIRTYWPRLTADMLAPGYAGVRPKISAPGEANADFRIDGPARHGLAGLVNLFGIESPGLTSSLAIADHVVELLS